MDAEKGTYPLGVSALILGLSLVLGFLFNHFFVEIIPGIAFPLFVFLIISGFIAIALYAKKPLKEDLYWLFPLLLFFAGMVALRGNELLMALNVLACLFLLLLITEVNVRGALRHFIPSDYLKLFFPPFKFIDPLIKTCSAVLSIHKRYESQQKTAQIIRGVAITVPIVILFTALFGSADPMFKEFVARFIPHINPEVIARTILVFVVTMIGTAAYAYTTFAVPETRNPHSGKRGLGTIEVSILLGAINALFFAFIAVQMTYFFGGESHVLAQGLTYAEYARRGFFELIAVAGLTYLILHATEHYIEKNTEHHARAFKMFSTALVLQVALVMVSAFLRLSLYEEAYGFTTLRFYSHIFVVFLGVIFASLLYKIYVEHKNDAFAFRAFLTAIVFLVGINVCNPDVFIAEKNLQRFSNTGKLDAHYLGGLSSDAIAQKMKVLEISTEEMQSIVKDSLKKRYEHPDLVAPEWQSWNLSRANERQLLAEYYR